MQVYCVLWTTLDHHNGFSIRVIVSARPVRDLTTDTTTQIDVGVLRLQYPQGPSQWKKQSKIK